MAKKELGDEIVGLVIRYSRSVLPLATCTSNALLTALVLGVLMSPLGVPAIQLNDFAKLGGEKKTTCLFFCLWSLRRRFSVVDLLTTPTISPQKR